MLNANAGTAVERPVREEDTYTMKLGRIFCRWGKPTQWAPDGAPKIAFVWEWADEETGEVHDLADWHNFPKNFSFNEKGAFWKRIGEIVGLPITRENAPEIGIDLGESVSTFAGLLEVLQESKDNLDVVSLKFGNQELIGLERRLLIGVWERDGRSGNSVEKVMQLKKAPLRQQAAPTQQMPPTTDQIDSEGLPF